MNPRTTLFGILIGLPGAAVLASGGGANRAPLDPAYVAECGSCHLAYPPRMLGAASWLALLGGLDQHFQVDATVETATLAQLNGYLTANSRRKPTGDAGAPALRISETGWFRHEHDDISTSQWSRVKSKSNCGGCHTGAAQGRYSEHELRLP
jgi:mono/diheme cytochrome c family protein